MGEVERDLAGGLHLVSAPPLIVLLTERGREGVKETNKRDCFVIVVCQNVCCDYDDGSYLSF